MPAVPNDFLDVVHKTVNGISTKLNLKLLATFPTTDLLGRAKVTVARTVAEDRETCESGAIISRQ